LTISKSDSHKILIVAAEASSSLYALRLLEHWRRENVSVEAFGIGSRDMEKQGFHILGRSEELAVVGIQEVVSHFGEIRKAFNNLVTAAQDRNPQVALLLDYPDFNLRLAKKLKALGIPVVYYISPQIWAWRQGRVHTIKRLVDKMLVLFPFEKSFYDRFQVPVEFVGHPLLDELDDRYFTEAYRVEHRSRYGLGDSDLVLALMPGSRKSELKHHLHLQLEVAEEVQHRIPNVRVALLVAPTFSVEEMKSLLPHLNSSVMIVKADPFEMIHLADVVLCASGTATLMVGLMQKPMVIMYRMNTVTGWMAKLFVRSTEFFGLINLVLGRRVVPELFQGGANSKALVREIEKFLTNEELRRKVSRELAEARHCLGDRGVTVRVARALSEFWRSP